MAYARKTEEGYDVHCFPGIQTEELHHQVEKSDLNAVCLEAIVIHSSTNSIRRETSVTEIMGNTLDLTDSIRKQAPTVKIVVSGS